MHLWSDLHVVRRCRISLIRSPCNSHVQEYSCMSWASSSSILLEFSLWVLQFSLARVKFLKKKLARKKNTDHRRSTSLDKDVSMLGQCCASDDGTQTYLEKRIMLLNFPIVISGPGFSQCQSGPLFMGQPKCKFLCLTTFSSLSYRLQNLETILELYLHETIIVIVK